MNTLLIVFFIIGYIAIIFEKFLHINKAAVALVMATICWLLFFAGFPAIEMHYLAEQIYDIAQIIFFLLAVMTVVELIDSHQGFKAITDILYTSSKKRMLWFLIGISFFMSAILDNLTTMIVMISLLRKMVKDPQERWMYGSLIVISVNAGGAWTPIGDVTTTMLWINERISTLTTIQYLFLPSLANVLVSGIIGSFFVKGTYDNKKGHLHMPMEPGARRVLILGIVTLISIPVWKAWLGLPPFMGALLALGLMWLITDLIHFRHGEERFHLRVVHILRKIDFSGVLFFLGILLAIDSLGSAGILKNVAEKMGNFFPSVDWVAVFIGLISSIIDNVPLVGATIGMYDITTYPINDRLWQLIAYAAGTGGSILIIGSAAGVAFMGIERIDFLWYMRKIAWIALAGYFAGIFVYFLIA